MFPYLDVDKYEINNNSVNLPQISSVKMKNKKYPYVIQIGAFGNLKNANRLKLQANQIGYEVDIVQVETKDRTLNAVRIIRYNSKTAAEKVGQIVKRKLGVDYRVLYRPVND
jgi:cell division septation protein DedD